jgi:hypothetical protein
LLYLGEGEVDYTVPEDEEEEEEPEEEIMSLPVTLDLPLQNDGKYQFDILDIDDLMWSTKDVSGDLPLLGTGSTLSYHEGSNSMYLYGGWNNHQFSSDVYCVSMDTWKWEKISLPEGSIKPSPRYLTGVLVHGDKLCNFGGVGPDIVKIGSGENARSQDEGAEYHGYVDKGVVFDYGWNNEYYEFDLEKSTFKHVQLLLKPCSNVLQRRNHTHKFISTCAGKWETPMSGTNQVRPPPVSAHVFTKFSDCCALYYGGRTKGGWSDATWIFNLDTKVIACNFSIQLPCYMWTPY